jgi:predicted DNA-binding transcriptional regulator AlpA
MSKSELWRDGGRIIPVGTPPQRTQIEASMKHQPNQCPPILFGDAKNLLNEFARFARSQKADESTDSEVLQPFATLTGLQNVAAYVSTAIRDAGSEVAESLDRLARAIENSSPATDPPKLVRLRDVARRIGLSSDSVMRLYLNGEFPKPVYLDGVPFFRESEVNEWLANVAKQN